MPRRAMKDLGFKPAVCVVTLKMSLEVQGRGCISHHTKVRDQIAKAHSPMNYSNSQESC